jgi:tRNA pseudouridine55 synthase
MSTKKRVKATVNGIFNINKPSGKTSQDVVAFIKRLSGQRYVGHAGTLDPLATGVLPVCLGQAARMSDFIMETHKTYIAEITLGVSTDTYDAEGTIMQEADPSHIDRKQVEALLPSLTGAILQKPPAYSALKRQGKRLYELARAGIDVETVAREVNVYRMEILEWKPPCFIIEIECGKGTYIRSIAHDIGQSLGCGAHMSALTRTRYGPFDVEDSASLLQIEDSFIHGYWRELIYPMDIVLRDWDAVILSNEHELAIRNGRPIPHVAGNTGTRCRAYSSDGRFIAVLRSLPEKGLLQPEKVFDIEQIDSIQPSNT